MTRAILTAVILMAFCACAPDNEPPALALDLGTEDLGTGDIGDDANDGDVIDAPDSTPDVDRDDATDATDIGDTGADVRDTTPGELNPCGGESDLAAAPGSACGDCDSGVWACDGADALRCDSERPANACGGCEAIPDIGTVCGPCGGVWTCGDEGVECSTSYNACGGCGDLEATPNTACALDGTRLNGAWACITGESVACVGQFANACGGSAALANAPGDACGACGLGAWTCDGTGALACMGADTGANACGGCGLLGGAVDDACGVCGGTTVCAGTEALECSDPLRNACGGCEALEGEPGDACGDDATWACDGAEAVQCLAAPSNACGGSELLDETPGAPCGACMAGRWLCADGDTLACAGDVALNDCGGCSALPGTIGERCGASGVWICDGASGGARCHTPAEGSACGGALDGALDGAVRDACGTCDTGVLVCDDEDALQCSGVDETALVAYFVDADGDGYGDDALERVEACAPSLGFSVVGGDCNDALAAFVPGAEELCDGEDNDCDGATDEDVTTVAWFIDADDDGFGDRDAEPVMDCAQPDGYVRDAQDCDDGANSFNPDADELCDGEDNDCDGVMDENVTNACGGCEALPERPGRPCGACLLDQLLCDGENAVVCDGDTPCPAFELTTEPPSAVSATAATFNGDVLSLPSPADASGFCWTTREAPAERLVDDCVEVVRDEVTLGGFQATVDTLTPGTTYRVRAWIEVDGDTLYGNIAPFDTLTLPVSGVDASDGLFAAQVAVSWDGVAGAVTYDVLRDGDVVATTDAPVTAWVDDSVVAPAPGPPTNVTVSAGTVAEHVAFTWEAPAPTRSSVHVYAVRAHFAAGTSGVAASDVGFAEIGSDYTYEWSVGSEPWVEAGTATSATVDAPAGSVVTTGVSASDGDFDDVQLRVLGLTETPGGPVAIRVRASSAALLGAPSNAVSGYRGVGDLTVQWEESEGDAPVDFQTLSGVLGTGASTVGGGARWYRAHITALGAAAHTTEPDRGFSAATAQVVLSGVVVESDTRARAGISVETVGGPLASAHGVCWSLASAPTVGRADTTCVDLGPTEAVATTEVTLTGLTSGTVHHLRTFATQGANTTYGAETTLLTMPASPSAVEATTGTSSEAVYVTWAPVVGATQYAVYRDGEELARPTEPVWNDTTVPTPALPSMTGVTLQASQGDFTDRVALAWDAPDAPAVVPAVYTVVAVNASGDSALSSPATGWATVPAVTAYEVSADDAAWVTIGDALAWSDLAAAAGNIQPGIAHAGQGTSPDFVALTIPTAFSTPGVASAYRVRAVTERGAGEPSAPTSGFRGVGDLQFQWERSADVTDSDFSALAGATSQAFEDTSAPSDGAVRWYRCQVTADGAAPVVSSAVDGWRDGALPAVTTSAPQATPTGLLLRGELQRSGTPAASRVGFCFSSLPTPALGGDATCLDATLGATPWPFELEVTEALLPGALYYVRAFAESPAGVSYGGERVVVTTPSAPTSLSASKGTSPDTVTVTWTAVPAARYRVLRDGLAIAETASTQYVDTTAQAPSVPSANGLVATASDGEFPDRVDVSWSVPLSSGGGVHNYTVVAFNDSGDSAPSPADDGWRAGAPVTGYELSADDGPWLAMDGRTFADFDAAPPTIQPGTAVASDALFTHVSLTLSGAMTSQGAARSYRVRALNRHGAGDASAVAIGRRGAGPLAYEWQRAPLQEGPWTALPVGNTATAQDTTAPLDGADRWYRCMLSATGAESVASEPDFGARRALPTVTTVSFTSTAPETASVTFDVTTLGRPEATVAGVCISETVAAPSPDNGARCETTSDALATGERTIDFDGLTGGASVYAQAFVTNGQGTALGGVIIIHTPPRAPANVTATDGTRADAVEVNWTPSPGALEYEILRDDVSLGRITGPPYVDLAAPAPSVPTGDFVDLTASQGTHSDRVEVAWTSVGSTPGTSAGYVVVAHTAAAPSVASEPDTGFRGAYPASDYEVSVNDGLWQSTAGARSLVDVTAEPPTLVAGDAVASDGTSAAVVLHLEGASAVDGAANSYRVRGVNEVGTGAASDAVSGFRSAGPIAYQWFRSTGSTSSSFSAIAGATTATYDDLGAPSDGDIRYYQCTLSADGAASVTSTADDGFRDSGLPVVETLSVAYNGGYTVRVYGDIHSRGTPAVTLFGACVATHPTPTLADTCTGFVVAAGSDTFAVNFYNIPPGGNYWVNTYAEGAEGVTYGNVLPFEQVAVRVSGAQATTTRSDGVAVTWNHANGAVDYEVLRDGVAIAVTSDLSYFDADAPTWPLPNVDLLSLAATTDDPHQVDVSWVAPTPTPGITASYTVVARNSVGAASPASVQTTGSRGPIPVTATRIEVAPDAGVATEFNLNGAATYADLNAPPGSVSVGTATASDGVTEAGVELLVLNATSTLGATVSYRVQLENDMGTIWSEPVSGNRTPQGFTIDWERSIDDSPTGFSSIGRFGAAVVDHGAPLDGAGRWYRARVRAAGTVDAISVADRGWRTPSACDGGYDWPDVSYLDCNGDGTDGDLSDAVLVTRFTGTLPAGVPHAETVSAGLNAAVATGRAVVLIAGGDYAEDGLVLPDGVSLAGGYAPDFSDRDIAAYPTRIIGTARALHIDGYTQAGVLQGLSLVAQSPSGAFDGLWSTAALSARDVNGDLKVAACDFVAESPRDGTDGTDGADGAAGEPGGSAIGSVGGVPGPSSCGARGGAGGSGVYDARGQVGQYGDSDGEAHGGGGSGGAPATGLCTYSARAGGRGDRTISGAEGDAPDTPPSANGVWLTVDTLDWRAEPGNPGPAGYVGPGGGGGGASGGGSGQEGCHGTGGGGGGGGSGGCGGQGGTPGESGGGAFGALLVDVDGLSFDGCTFVTARGGAGGDGGDGGVGGAGGAGGAGALGEGDPAIANVRGGLGGYGSVGGGGAGGTGGNGGASVGIFVWHGDSPATIACAFQSAGGGAGGVGGQSPEGTVSPAGNTGHSEFAMDAPPDNPVNVAAVETPENLAFTWERTPGATRFEFRVNEGPWQDAVSGTYVYVHAAATPPSTLGCAGGAPTIANQTAPTHVSATCPAYMSPGDLHTFEVRAFNANDEVSAGVAVSGQRSVPDDVTYTWEMVDASAAPPTVVASGTDAAGITLTDAMFVGNAVQLRTTISGTEMATYTSGWTVGRLRTGTTAVGGPCADSGWCAEGNCHEGLCLPGDLVVVPAGAGTLLPVPPITGDNEPDVIGGMERPLWMTATEVTRAAWSAVTSGITAETPWRDDGCGDDCPANGINWWDAVHFANLRSTAEGLSACYTMTGCTGTFGAGCLPTETHCVGDFMCTDVQPVPACTGYRLPTEWEWEWAFSSGGTETAGWYADDVSERSQAEAASCALTTDALQPVRRRAPNQLGLFDMSGSVWEWVFETRSWDEPDDTDGVLNRTMRGGFWESSLRDLRRSARGAADPRGRNHDRGLRLVRAAAFVTCDALICTDSRVCSMGPLGAECVAE